MPRKRQWAPDDAGDGDDDILPRKLQRLNRDSLSRRNPNDRLSLLSDELTLRVLSFLSIGELLGLGLVSKHLHRLASDSQLWRALYYARFVLPRALRIPGFRDGSKRHGSKLHYTARRAVWADGGRGKRGGLVNAEPFEDWKRQYKLRHNWARGKASVEELDVGGTSPPKKTLVKVVEGIAVTADKASGLRAWDLKTKALLAQVDLLDEDDVPSCPTCLGVDEQALEEGGLDICLGFVDGSFGVWRLDLASRTIALRQSHGKSSNGELIGIAYRHPYLLAATESVLISLYDFDQSQRQRRLAAVAARGKLGLGYDSDWTESETEDEQGRDFSKPRRLPVPILVTSLQSHTSHAPLALSIRGIAGSVVASVAYTFTTFEGWSIGIQDLHIGQLRSGESAVMSTRLAYTMPVVEARPLSPVTPTRQPSATSALRPRQPHESSPSPVSFQQGGPRTLCYTHPYLLATLPDNTLILHVCTSSADALSVSPGIRLWGHTSGISDAEITARGKAVSVSCRGEEIRVWELEGRAGGKSIEIRPSGLDDAGGDEPGTAASATAGPSEWDDKRNWVGFDDEMVIVLKESQGGRESLVVYDFT
jgi:F-box associated protein